MRFVFRIRKSQDVREESLVGTLDVSRPWRREKVVWKLQLQIWRKVEFRSFTDGTTIQGNTSSSLYKCQCLESWNFKSAERKRNHTLQCGCFKHRTLVPNHSFCKSAQYLRSSLELVCAIRFNSGREGPRKNSRKMRIREHRHWRAWTTRSELYGVFSKDWISTLKQIAGKRLKTSNRCPRLFNSPVWANSHRSGTGHRLVWATRPFGTSLPRKYTLLRASPLSRAYAAILGGTIIVPVIEVHIVKILDSFGLEIEISSPYFPKRTSWVLISREQSRFVDELHIPNARHNLTSAEYSLNMKKRMKVNFVWRNRRLAFRKLVRSLNLAPGNWIRTLLGFLLTQCTTRIEPYLRRKGSGNLFVPFSSYTGRPLSTPVISNMVTIMVHHFDQEEEERQTDAAVH